MDHDGNAALSSTPAIGRYDVAVVDPDARVRTKLVMQLAGSWSARSYESLDEFERDVHTGRPVVLVCGPGLANAHALEQIHRATSTIPEVGVVVAAEELSTPLLQHALRAGARDAVMLAGGDALLREAIHRVGGELVSAVAHARATAAVPAEMGRLIVSFSTKGGVGKSVVATNVAVSLARRCDRPVALLDADLQFGDVAVLLGVPPQHTVVDAAASSHQDDPELMRRLVSLHEPSGLLILPAPVEPSVADQVRPEEMLKIVESLQRFCAFVVVDMPPHFDDLVLALVEAADEVLVVASMDIPSVKNLKIGMQTLDLLSLAGDKLRLVLNRANAKVKLDVKEVERALGLKAEFPIPSDIAVVQAVNRGVPVVLDAPRSPAARAFQNIADSILGTTEDPADEEQPERRRRWRRGRNEEETTSS